MLPDYSIHNLFWEAPERFYQDDPHLRALSQLTYQYQPNWWSGLSVDMPGIYILMGGRQVGKSTSCKLFIKDLLQQKAFAPDRMCYLPCDEIYDAKSLSHVLRSFLEAVQQDKFLLVIDEITFVKDWDRVIKALADEGHFQQGLCLLTGSDTLILKEAAMRFPGRRGMASQMDFHLHPLSFREYVDVRGGVTEEFPLSALFQDYLHCGGYLRAINDLAQESEISNVTFLTYEQWLRGDFLRRGKNEEYLTAILASILTVGVSQISYSRLTREIGLISKETCIDYLKLLERMDVLINLQAFDQNKKQGFPRKDRKFHFFDPFIKRTVYQWLMREGYLNELEHESALVESCVASHCHRFNRTYYFKGQGEVDVVRLREGIPQAIEVKWSENIRPNDLKTIKQFDDALILTKQNKEGVVENIPSMPVFQFLYEMN